MSDLIGQSLGRYHILEQLGEGGMATVYKAYDTRLERDVAIKVIRRGAFPPDELERMLKRFEREAKSLAKLSHPNIVGVIDYGEHEGSPYLVMEYLPGGTLKQRLGKPIPWQAAVRLLSPVAQAVEYAHEHNIIHRDIKPSNILLTEKSQPMLTDFGIAKILETDETATLTGPGVGVGTPEYMAPEQWTGQTTNQSDIYSLGIVMYELVTGRKPYVADTPAAILLMQATDPLPRPTQFVSDLPVSVEKILLKALAKRPEDRYASMGDFAIALESTLSGIAAPAKPQPVRPRERTQDLRAGSEQTEGTTIEEAPYAPAVLSSASSGLRRYWPIGLVVALCLFGLILLVAFGGRLSAALFPASASSRSALVDQMVNVIGNGGFGEVKFRASKGQRIQISLSASNPSMEPYGFLQFPDGSSEYTPPLNAALNGTNEITMTLNLDGEYQLIVFDGSNQGGPVSVKITLVP